jgi:hypothetical protein
MKYVSAAVLGAGCSVAWALWGLACSDRSALLAAVADIAVVSLGAVGVNYYTERRHAEFAAYVAAAAIGTYFTVRLA